MTLIDAIKLYRVQLTLCLLLFAGLYSMIIPPMVMQWYQDPNYSHGFIVPLISAYFLYQRRQQLVSLPIEPSNIGLPVVVIGLFQMIIGWAGSEYFTMRVSLVVVLAGMILYLFGLRVFRYAAFPILYLLFMVPLPYIVYDGIAFPLKLFVTWISVETLQLLGVTVLREGNIIMFPTTTLEVADACSGIRSLLSLAALAVAIAFSMKFSPAWRTAIALSAVPIAISANVLRVVVTGILAQFWGARAAEGFFHEFAGLAVFGLAIIMLLSLAALGRRYP